MALYEDQKDLLIDYFKSGEKSRDDFKVGVEFEHIAVDRRSLESVSIYGDNGISDNIARLESRGWDVDYQEGYAVGAVKDPYTISTEPAGQFEVSIAADDSIISIQQLYILFIEEVIPIFYEKGQRLLGIGYHPVTKIDDIKISPKKRYSFMYEHFKTRGSRSHNMMKGTAAVQVVLDYESEEDFIRKYKIGSYLSPILYTIFENAYIFEGQPTDFHGVRQYIWKNTDPSRSGLLPSAFDDDFSYEKYAEYILNTDPIFLETDNGPVSSEGKLFREILDPNDYSEDEIFHAISIVFPDVRLKKYLEYRMMDALPYPLNFSPVSLIVGLLYNEENIEELMTLFEGTTFEMADRAKKDSSEKGLEAEYKGKTIKDWGLQLIELAEGKLEQREKALLIPIKDLLLDGQSPRDYFKGIYEEEGLKAAVKETVIEV